MPDSLNKPWANAIGALVRGLHGLLVLGFLGAWVTSEFHGLAWLHRACGYTVMAALSARLVVSASRLPGTDLMRWWRRAQGWPRWWQAAAQGRVRFEALSALGLASTVIALLVLSGVTFASGWWLDRLGVSGEAPHAWEELHEALAELLMALVLLHAGLVLALSFMRGRNMAWEMVVGRRQREARRGQVE